MIKTIPFKPGLSPAKVGPAIHGGLERGSGLGTWECLRFSEDSDSKMSHQTSAPTSPDRFGSLKSRFKATLNRI